MKKMIVVFLFCMGFLLGSSAFAEDCSPNFQPDYKTNTGDFDVNTFTKQNSTEDSAGSVQMCFLGTTSGGMNPSAVFNNVCGCKDEIKKHCSLHHGNIRASGVPTAWCAPFAPFL